MSKAFVMDTNTLVSAALIANSVNAQALNKILHTGFLAFSRYTFSELIEVIYRPKFDRYLSNERRSQIIDNIEQYSQRFVPSETVTACSDPKDNMFLELAAAANAVCIITGDKALKALHPFREIPILSAADFLLHF
jgi:putative PIN family toxin of toxin-antitoxin system